MTGLVFSPAAAQTAHLTAAFTVVPSNGLTNPGAVAIDASGNVYIADTGNNRIVIETPQAYGGYSQSTLTTATSLDGPQGVAVDANGCVYIADTQNHRVLEESPSINPVNGITTYGETTVANFAVNDLELPTAVAVDKNLAVYMISYGNNAAVKMTPNGSGGFTQSVIAVGPTVLYGIAVDASLNVYVTAYDLGDVFELPWTGAAYGTLTAIQIQLNHPAALAVDANQTVYVADSGNNRIIEDIHTSGTNFDGYSFLMGLSNPLGVAVDPHGNLYIADTGIALIMKESKAGVNFGPSAVAGTPMQAELLFTFDTGGGIVPAVLTQGISNLDFTDSDTGTCTEFSDIPFDAGDTCTVMVNFTPAFAGARYGAVVLKNSSNAAIATAPLQGAGLAPQIAFQTPGLQAQSLGSGFVEPSGLAMDGSGNVYVTDAISHAVYEAMAAGGYSTVNQLASGFSFADPNGVAVDGAGNLYISDTDNGAVEEIDHFTGSVTTLSSSFNYPQGVAVDGLGNVFVADSANAAVKEILAVHGVIPASPTINTLGGSFVFGYPEGITVDANGNVYFSDGGNHAVYQIPAGGGYATVNPLGSGFKCPSGLAVDSERQRLCLRSVQP